MVSVWSACRVALRIPLRPSAISWPMNMSSFRKYGRYSMNLAMEQERLQGWLSVANVVDSGKKRLVVVFFAASYT